VMLLAINIVQW